MHRPIFADVAKSVPPTKLINLTVVQQEQIQEVAIFFFSSKKWGVAISIGNEQKFLSSFCPLSWVCWVRDQFIQDAQDSPHTLGYNMRSELIIRPSWVSYFGTAAGICHMNAWLVFQESKMQYQHKIWPVHPPPPPPVHFILRNETSKWLLYMN